jgi:hypothetical protein
MFNAGTVALLQNSGPPEAPDSSVASQGVVFSGLVILAATASLVIASVSRQENLSNRTRALARELRETASLKETTLIDRNRLHNLPKQIIVFHDRLNKCVRGHICLYLALVLEGLGFGVSFIAALLHGSPDSRLVVAIYPVFALAFLFLLSGLWFHIKNTGAPMKQLDWKQRTLKRTTKARLIPTWMPS